MSYLLAILASVSNAVSNICQRRADRDEPASLAFRFRMILDLLRRPVWLAGIAAVTVSFVLQTAALDRAPLAVIEPIIVLELPLTLVAAVVAFGARLGGRDVAAIAAMALGVAGLIASLAPGNGRVPADPAPLILAGVATMGLAVVLFILGRASSGNRQAALLGACTGVGFGLSASFLKATTQSFSSGVVATLTSPDLYVAVSVGIASMLVLQNALRAGRLVASQPWITVLDPVVSVLWGVLVYGEQTRSGAYLVAAVVSGALLAGGAAVLARSPTLAGLELGDATENGPVDPADPVGVTR